MSSASSSFHLDWPGPAIERVALIVWAALAAAAVLASGLPWQWSLGLWALAAGLCCAQQRRRRRPQALLLLPPDALCWRYADGAETHATLRGWRRLGPLLQLRAEGERTIYWILWLPGMNAALRRGLMRALARMSAAAG